jgi:hypothetical protein
MSDGTQAPFSVWRWLCVEPALEALNRGPVLRKGLGFLVQLAAVLLALFAFSDWCRMWPVLRHQSFVEGLGYALMLLGLLYGGFLALQTMFVRGGQIRELPESEFVAAPIAGMLAALWGEMLFLFLAIVSAPVMVGVWCESRGVSIPLFWRGNSDNRFLDGLFLFLSCWITGFAALVAGRLIKEWLSAVIGIAQDVRAIRGR